MPLLDTVLRADEAYYGIHHALGITVDEASDSWLTPPATDGNQQAGTFGTTNLYPGKLFKLRSDFMYPANAGIGVHNIIRALKFYGAYVVDDGSNGPWELDADPESGDDGVTWNKSGIMSTSPDGFSAITADDFRPVNFTSQTLQSPTSCPAH
jgi:hypothetical protein